MKRARLALFALALVGCNVPVAAGLDENDANRIVVALDHASVDAAKEIDPGSEGKFRVVVARDDAARAIERLRDEGLPRPKPQGVLDAMDKGALVPSRAAEHAQIVAGMAGDLERTLESVDGVIAARVHLNVPEPDPFRDAPRAKATASVLVEHLGATPPLANAEVQRLVAGGVPGLAADDVAVVAVARPAPPASDVARLSHVGPIAVAHGSMRVLQIALVALVALVAILAGATLVLYMRLARLRIDSGGDGRAT